MVNVKGPRENCMGPATAETCPPQLFFSFSITPMGVAWKKSTSGDLLPHSFQSVAEAGYLGHVRNLIVHMG